MTRFVRTVAAALALTAILATPRAGDAQVLVNESTGTPVPLAFVYLNAGTTYYFTTAVTSPLVPGGATQNPVLTLMSDWNIRVAGAQMCGLDFTKACFTYTPTTSNLYMLVLHGDNTLSPGRATVWQSLVAYCTNSLCNNAGPIAKTQIWNDVAFGGDTVTVTAANTGRVHYHTLHRPGNAIFHTLFARTTATNFPERISRIAFNGWSGTGRIRGTVKFDTTDPTAFGINGIREWVVGPSFPDQRGAVRLVRNTWFTATNDGDGDGISYEIETDPAIRSCDLAIDTTPNGNPCSALHPVCAGASANMPICLKLLRDTDSDGLRDDLEIYGYDGTVDELLPMWGANPTHIDVFVELDAYDQNDAPNSQTTCQGFSLPTATAGPNVVPVQMIGCSNHQQPNECVAGGNHFFDRIQDIYGGAPARINPDGAPGISIHFDVGVDNPDPLDTRFGNWGGGNTCLLRDPTDPAVLDCPSNPDDDGFCSYQEAYDGVVGCGCPATPRIRPERKWIFRWGIDEEVDGVGQTAGDKRAYANTQLSPASHELGHMLGLSHGGPTDITFGGRDGEAHERPFYPSRINYRFQDFAGRDGAINLLRWSTVRYSGGAFTRPWSNADSIEVDPMPGFNYSILEDSGLGFDETILTTGSGQPCVDWNKDGTCGTPSWNRTYFDTLRRRRSHLFDSPEVATGGTDLAVVGNYLVYAYATDIGSVKRLRFRSELGGDCSRWPDRTAAIPFQPCVRFGERLSTTVEADAVAIAPWTLASGTAGAVVVYRRGSSLRWGQLTVSGGVGGTTNEGTVSYTDRGSLNTDSVLGSPTLVRDGAGVRVLYQQNALSSLREAFLPDLASGWGAANNCAVSSGPTLTGVASSPAAFNSGGVHVVARVGTTTQIWRRNGSLWDPIVTLSGVDSGATEFEAVVAPALGGGTGNQFLVYYRIPGTSTTPFPDLRLQIASSTTSAVPTTSWTDGGSLPGSAGRFRAAAAYDGRGGVLSIYRDVRVISEQHQGGTTGGQPNSVRQSLPFSRGIEVAYWCDYDDWVAMRRSACRYLPSGSRPTTTNDFVRIPYSDFLCPSPPIMREADPAGGGTCTPIPGGLPAFVGPPPEDIVCN